MKIWLLLALFCVSVARAENAPETPVMTGPSFQQIPASKILVRPDGGIVQTLGAALAAAGGGPTGSTGSVQTNNGAGGFAGVAASSLGVTATGGTTSSPLSQRFGEVSYDAVADFGVVCDGSAGTGTDNTSRLQAAINAAASKAWLYIPNSGVCETKQLTVPANSHILVDGKLQLLNGSNVSGTGYIFSVGAVNNVVIEGAGTLDANSSGQTGSNFSAGIVTNGSTNVTIRDLTITNSRNWPLNIANTTHCLLDNLKIITGGNSPQFGSASNDCWARKLYVTGINDESFAFYGGVFNSGISESFLTSGAADGISVLNDSGNSAPSHQIIIAHNFVTAMASSGVAVSVGSGGVGNNFDIQIVNNELTANGVTGSGGPGGVLLSAATKVLVQGNRISKDLGTNAAQVIGIWAKSSSNQIDILDNIVLDEGQTAGSIGTCIHLDVTDVIVRVAGNKCWDTQGTHTMTVGISTAALNNNVITNNLFGGVATHYSASWPSDTIFIALPNEPQTITTIPSGSTYSTNNNMISKVILSSGVTTPFTFTLPPAAMDNAVLTLQCDIAITLTVSPNSGQSLTGAPTACSATQGHQFQYTLATTTWRVNY